MSCCRTLSFCLFVFLSACLFGCKTPQKKPPLAHVYVTPVQKQQYYANQEYVGRLEAVNDATIHAQVTGYLQSVHFIEGDIVEKDALLFIIDPSIYKVKLSGAKASVSQAAALLEEAQLNFNRGSKLIKQGAISRSELDRLTAKLHSTQANMQVAKAKEKSAVIDLQYTQLKAPFRGRIGEKKFSIGDLVKSGAEAPLTTIVSIDPIYATFQVNAKTYEKVARRRREAIAQGKKPMTFTAHLKLASGDIYPFSGDLDFVSNRINAETDSIMIRAIFANYEGSLRPGQYVRVRIDSNQSTEVLTVPQASVISNQEGDFIYTVTDEDIVKSIKVTLDDNIKEQVIVEGDGLKEGQRVIEAGVQKVKPGQKVDAQAKAQENPKKTLHATSP